MPIYEYSCKCGNHFEEMQPFSHALFTKCPKCGKRANRMISMSAFHLKGSGWYSKDVESKSAKAPAKKDEPAAASSSETKAETKTEKPAETKTETKSEEKPKKKEEAKKKPKSSPPAS